MSWCRPISAQKRRSGWNYGNPAFRSTGENMRPGPALRRILGLAAPAISPEVIDVGEDRGRKAVGLRVRPAASRP